MRLEETNDTIICGQILWFMHEDSRRARNQKKTIDISLATVDDTVPRVRYLITGQFFYLYLFERIFKTSKHEQNAWLIWRIRSVPILSRYLNYSYPKWYDLTYFVMYVTFLFWFKMSHVYSSCLYKKTKCCYCHKLTKLIITFI